jgi:hypothetical protein
LGPTLSDDIDDDNSTDESSALETAHVGVALELTPRDQSRLSVFFRLLLLIPFAIFLEIWAVAVFVVAVLSWFAAMWNGTVPKSLRRFMTSFVQYILEYGAFSMLLTSRLPGLNNPPSRGPRPLLEVDEVHQSWPGLLFRLVLAIPAYVVSVLFIGGASLYAVVMWFAELFTGRAPASLHVANSLAVRFYVRAWSYFLLLTPTQPFAGAFGDLVASPIEDVKTSEEPEAPPSPAYQPPSIVPVAPPAAEEVEALEAPLDPRAEWTVDAGSSVLAKIAIALGVIVLVANSLLGVASRDLFKSPSEDAIVATRVVYLDVAIELTQLTRVVPTCTTLACVQQVAQEAESAILRYIDTFQHSAAAKSPPQPEYERYIVSLEAIATELSYMSTATTVAGAVTHYRDLPTAFLQAGHAKDRLIAAF